MAIEVLAMPRKKKTEPADWVSVSEAADIITAHSDRERPVSTAYVRKLGNEGRIETWTVNTRIKLYKRSDVEKTRVEQYKKRE